jgi:hypothetical protein
MAGRARYLQTTETVEEFEIEVSRRRRMENGRRQLTWPLHSGNRLEDFQPGFTFNQISELHLDQTLMPWDQVCSQFGSDANGTYLITSDSLVGRPDYLLELVDCLQQPDIDNIFASAEQHSKPHT